MRCVRIRKNFSILGAMLSPYSNGIEGRAKEKAMTKVKNPGDKANESEDKVERPFGGPKARSSEEIDFIVRREHRRQHREDRAI